MESMIPCRFCNRRFSSKSAMWGHSRIHYNTYKGPDLSKILGSNLKKQVMDIPGEEIYPICNKNFHLVNTLFGQRRFHPDNQCKGIYPSPRANKLKMDETGPSQEAFPRDVNKKKHPKVLDFDLNEFPPTNQE